MKRILTMMPALIFCCCLQAQDAKMNTYISNLMSRMTVDEKIGQLNLVIPGGAVTGSVVSKDVNNKIRQGMVGGLFGITGPDKVRQAQDMLFTVTVPCFPFHWDFPVPGILL
jgi:beta-glucosidase